MEQVIGVLIFLIAFLLFVPFLLLLNIHLSKKEQFKRLIKLNRTEETDFKEFNRYFNIISNKFNILFFEIVYWKNGSTIIKVNKDYYEVTPTSMLLIFNEDEHLTTEFEEYCNQ